MTCQGNVQAAVRTRHGQAGNRDWNGDWHELFDQDGIAAGTFNGRLLTWLNAELVTDGDTEAPYDTLPGAQQAYASRTGAYNWNSMTTLL